MKVTSAPKQAISFVRESKDELQKVNWPTREQTVRYTIIVVLAYAVVGLVIGGFDYLLTLIFEKIIL